MTKLPDFVLISPTNCDFDDGCPGLFERTRQRACCGRRRFISLVLNFREQDGFCIGRDRRESRDRRMSSAGRGDIEKGPVEKFASSRASVSRLDGSSHGVVESAECAEYTAGCPWRFGER